MSAVTEPAVTRPTSARIECSVDGDVATITISNESKLNALTIEMWSQLASCFIDLANSDTCRCIVVRGAGERAFSAGADIAEFATTRDTRDQVIAFHENRVGVCLAAIRDCDVPVIAAIRGVCMGGGLEIACAADLRIADADARFGAPVGKLGFPLAFGETQALFSVVGRSVAAEILIEGRILSSDEACSRGLVTRVCPPGMFEMMVKESIRNVCQSSLSAARSHKRQLRRLARDPSPVSEAERFAVYDEFAGTEEYREGYSRFLSKARSRQ